MLQETVADPKRTDPQAHSKELQEVTSVLVQNFQQERVRQLSPSFMSIILPP
jgi:hypothetical protein